jgi:PAS domain S-box-containing protein
MEISPTLSSFKFLQSGGQMGERIRSCDWNDHPLGPIPGWPLALRSALSICLNAGFPIAIYWGPDFHLLYNDAWSHIPGDKHPWALGKPAREVWPEIWDIVGPQFDDVIGNGNSFRSTDVQLPMERFGYPEETYFDYNLSPIYLADGSIGGVFNAGIETTYRVVNERRNVMMNSFLEKINPTRTEKDTWEAAFSALGAMPLDLPYALHYSCDTANELQLQSFTYPVPGPLELSFREAILSGSAGLVETAPISIAGAAWPEACTEAVVLPLRQSAGPGQDFLVCGISPRRRLDQSYQQFLDSIALHLAAALTHSRSLEQEAQVRQRLEQSEDNLRRLFMQAPMGICILRGDEMFVELVNDAYLAIVQRPRAQLEYRPIWEGIPEVKNQGFDELLKKVMRTGEPFIGRDQQVQINRSGRDEIIYVDFVYEPLRDQDGNISRIMALVIDVTDKVLARRAIELSEERARLAIDSAELGTFDVNLATSEIVASSRMAEIMGIAHTDDRKRYITAIHPDDQQVRSDAYRRAYETGYLQYEGRVVWKDNSVHWIRVKGRVYFNEEKKPQQLLGVVQDITEMKEFAAELTRQVEERTQALQNANMELERSNAELEQFAYVSSHDLQEPLRKIRLFADVILEQEYEKLSAHSRMRFEKITAASDRMSRSLRDLLEYASLGRLEQQEPVDLNEVLQHVTVDLELLIAQKGAKIHSEKLPVLQAIPLQMQQLFYNLVNNALKFNRSGITPEIHITCSQNEAAYEIRVADNGIGFDQQHARKIFTIFQRLHDRNAYSGSGIGLALCKKVVENHSGSIRAEGKPGEGAIFIINFPLKAE